MGYPSLHGVAIFERHVLNMILQDHVPRNTYLEIGGYEGGSLYYFSKLLGRGSTLVSIDLPIRDECRDRLLETAAALNDDGFHAHIVLGDSRDAETKCAAVTALGGREVDTLFIDGNHWGTVPASDVANFVSLVRPGGLVIIHGVGPCLYGGSEKSRERVKKNIAGCYPAWAELADRNERKLIAQTKLGFGLVWLDEWERA